MIAERFKAPWPVFVYEKCHCVYVGCVLSLDDFLFMLDASAGRVRVKWAWQWAAGITTVTYTTSSSD